MRFTRSLGFAGALVAAALVGGTLIGSTLATDEPTDVAADASAACDVFMDTMAADLGVTRDSLVAAAQSAANAALDAAVEADDLSEERAEAIRDRIAAYDGEGCGWFGPGFKHGFRHGFERGMARGFLGAGALEEAAEALGLGTAELLEAVRDAGSLKAVADAQGVPYADVEAAVLAAVQATLDEAVADGLSQARADAMIERVTAWLDGGGELPQRDGAFRHHRHGPGWDGDGEEQDTDGSDT